VIKKKVSRTQASVSVMVWAGITRNGKTPLIFVEKGVKINQVVYKEMIEEKMLPWARKHFGKDCWTFQQDSAPAHKAKKVQEFLASECPDFISAQEWPPSSPDLNPMNYAVCNMIEAKVCSKSYRFVDALKRKLKKEWEKLDPETIKNCYDDWWKRLDLCIKAKESHFE
jgi:inhibitor of nuclear factor kappa-B kinase subunit alpha